jgi:NADPH-dependent 2,4-dienoyl-CoA reductase/sulfur reductase-like enzyme
VQNKYLKTFFKQFKIIIPLCQFRQMEYAYLVLAMGATPRKLAAIKSVELQREVLYMRTLEDAKRMAMETAGKSVAIVGAGMLGFFFSHFVN